MNYLKKLLEKRKKKALPTLYDRYNNPLVPPEGSRHSKNKHKYQSASLFTKKETEDLLEKQSIKEKESKYLLP